MKEIFWTDSKTVLGYINNDARRFHVFVGNRVQEIREQSSPNQWHYVETKSNPADIASRGAGAQELIDNPLGWNGPEFLWNPCKDWDSVNDNLQSLLMTPKSRKFPQELLRSKIQSYHLY